MPTVTPGYTFTGATDPITSTKLNLLSTPSVTIGNGEVVTATISDNAVTTAKIAALAVTTAKIDALAVTTAKIDALAVTTAKINALAVTSAELAANAATTAKINDLAVTTAKINDLAVTTAKINDLAVNAAKIFGGSVTLDKLFTVGSNNRFIARYTTVAPATAEDFQLLDTTVTGLGFYTGAGGVVSQGNTSGKATTFTLDKMCGQITTDIASLAAATIVSATWNNSLIAATDVVIINHKSGGTMGSYTINVACGAGTATLSIRNNTASPLSDNLVLNFVVIKGVTS
jgi:hypothetical protein